MNKPNMVTVNNIEYIIKNKNDLIQSTLLKGNQWNNNIVLLIGHLVKKYNLKHFVNIGSHIGTVALPISKYIERVTAIEAFPPTYKHFLEHTKLNNNNLTLLLKVPVFLIRSYAVLIYDNFNFSNWQWTTVRLRTLVSIPQVRTTLEPQCPPDVC